MNEHIPFIFKQSAIAHKDTIALTSSVTLSLSTALSASSAHYALETSERRKAETETLSTQGRSTQVTGCSLHTSGESVSDPGISCRKVSMLRSGLSRLQSSRSHTPLLLLCVCLQCRSPHVIVFFVKHQCH